MKAIAYQFRPAESIGGVAQAMAHGGFGCKPIAGGQSLGPMLNLRLAQPDALLDLDRLDGLRAVHEATDAITFGALITHAQIEDGRVPDPSRGLMPHVASRIAYRAVRNRGTLGGSLCHADPAADWVSTMPLLGATLIVANAQDERREIAVGNFMTGAFETSLGDGELLVAVRVPSGSEAALWSYRKFCRKTGEFAKAIVAAWHDPATGVERLVLGALDGAPHVCAQPGLLQELSRPNRRAAWLRDALPDLDAERFALQAEMLRLVVIDMETAR